MSRTANPATIGGFVISAVVVAIAAVGFLASGALFSDYDEYVSYFPESVNGLSVGAPVKFRGVAMGQVTRIGLYGDQEGTAHAEVVFKLEHDRWTRLGGELSQVGAENIRRLVGGGLRSRLEVESIVTGVVFITLQISEDAGPPIFINPESKFVEIPSAPSPMSELTESAGEVIARLGNIDVNSISDNLVELTATLNQKLLDTDVASISENLKAATLEVRMVLEDGELRRAISGLTETLEEIQQTNVQVKDRVEDLTVAFVRLDTVMANLQSGTVQFAGAARNANEMLEADAEFRSNLEQAVEETALAMQSLRRLTDMIERNPRAFLTGKSEDRK